jgi:hypothetical protein
VGHEDAQIPGGRIGHPDRGEAIGSLQKVEYVVRVAAIGLRLPHDLRPNRRGLAGE